MKPKLSIVITGASRGIGLAIARALKDQTEKIALVASSLESFELIRDEFKQASFHGADFSNPDEIKHLAQALEAGSDRIDVLINNCGVYEQNSLAVMSETSIETMIDINVTAPLLLTKMLLGRLKKSQHPIIINISSIQAVAPSEGHSVYAASKVALSTFSDVLRKELNPKGVRVTVIQPSGVNTLGEEVSEHLLEPNQIGNLVKQLVEMDENIQIDTITLSAL